MHKSSSGARIHGQRSGIGYSHPIQSLVESLVNSDLHVPTAASKNGMARSRSIGATTSLPQGVETLLFCLQSSYCPRG